MTPEEVLEASLKGLTPGEVTCIPVLDNPNLLAQVDGSQRQLLEQSWSGSLAELHQVEPP
ncbi:hypothetical protein KQ306_04720 [Synechococcus sp. CS-1324]|uniref:hypothetical protein n=1 Tax=Synechococcus sp. CS-1324 TaxID=2847980 RepID=UPI00223BD147|nr:hypothetical protein [Synechococcus sp. CS-1324]MCT0230165.1 hypothetical protein [Synechococcus sp. CS-1324]